MKICIIDDHEIFSNGLKLILENKLPVTVIYSFCKATEALSFFESNGPVELIILDLNMPDMDGFSFLEKIKRIHPMQKVLVISMHHTNSHVDRCKSLGASGFIKKDDSLEKLLHTAKQVIQGNYYFDTNTLPVDDQNVSTVLKSKYKLSPTELKIIDLLLEQKENKEIADQLHLSYLTVKTHRKNIYRKLGVHSLAGIVAIWKDVVEGNQGLFP
jgi:DNA-binding NarL/FixJ family response regulator